MPVKTDSRFLPMARAAIGALILAVWSAAISGYVRASDDDRPGPPNSSISLRLVPPPQEIGTGHILMDCSFDGSPAACELDTGAGDRIAVPLVAAFQSYRPIEAGSSKDGVGQDRPADIIRIGRLRVGDLDFGAVSAKRVRRIPQAIPPLIGAQALTRRGFALRFVESHELVLNPTAPPGTRYPMELDYQQHLLIPISLGESGATALFDTGSGLTEIDREYVASHAKDFRLIGMLKVAGRPDAEIYRLPLLTIGERRFADVAAVATDFSFMKREMGVGNLRLLLGYNVITSADWYFDLANRTWSILK